MPTIVENPGLQTWTARPFLQEGHFPPPVEVKLAPPEQPLTSAH